MAENNRLEGHDLERHNKMGHKCRFESEKGSQNRVEHSFGNENGWKRMVGGLGMILLEVEATWCLCAKGFSENKN